MTREIPLTRGLVAIVDDMDWPRLARHEWSASQKGPRIYAVRMTSKRRPPARMLYMHWEILQPQPGWYVDHANGDGLDNRRSNLRLADQFQNSANAGLSLANTSGFKGIYLDRRRGTWVAAIQAFGIRRYLGEFEDPQNAAEAYDLAALNYFGRFARTNRAMGLL